MESFSLPDSDVQDAELSRCDSISSTRSGVDFLSPMIGNAVPFVVGGLLATHANEIVLGLKAIDNAERIDSILSNGSTLEYKKG